MLDTLDFTGSKHWTSFNFSYSTALGNFVFIHIVKTH